MRAAKQTNSKIRQLSRQQTSTETIGRQNNYRVKINRSQSDSNPGPMPCQA